MIFSATFQTFIFFKVDSVLSNQGRLQKQKTFLNIKPQNLEINIYLYRFHIAVIPHVHLTPEISLPVVLLTKYFLTFWKQ